MHASHLSTIMFVTLYGNLFGRKKIGGITVSKPTFMRPPLSRETLKVQPVRWPSTRVKLIGTWLVATSSGIPGGWSLSLPQTQDG